MIELKLKYFINKGTNKITMKLKEKKGKLKLNLTNFKVPKIYLSLFKYMFYE